MTIRSRALTSSLMATVLLAACSPDSNLSPADPADPAFAGSAQASAQEPEFVPNELIVRFRSGASAGSRGAAMRAANAQVQERIITGAMRRNGDDEGITVLRIPGNVPDAVLAMRGLDDVEYAEPNWIYRTDATSNDTYYANGSLWGMYGATTSPNNQYGSGAAAAWASGTTCGNVYVGIIDEGYMITHSDLSANVGTTGDLAGDGVDNDGNGYIDDVYGWDFAGNNASVFDGVDDDHGTHVAGTIGGTGGNGAGVAGVCWSVKLLSAKFLGRNGGTTANAVKAVDYFTGLKARGINIVATNNSWGGGGYSQALGDAIGRAGSAGILFIAAAGNSALNCDSSSACYPGEYENDNIISVASITSSGTMSSFSNYGSTTIDIGAPGSAIWSTVPTSSRGGKQIGSGYASYSGTSMATPHVTGAAALYAHRHPGSTAAQIKAAILGGTATPSLSGRTLTGRRLNVSGF